MSGLIVIFLWLTLYQSSVCATENMCLYGNGRGCCTDYYLKNGKCVVCPLGTFGKNCESECPNRYFGLRCKNQCKCPGYFCDKKYGCQCDDDTKGSYCVKVANYTTILETVVIICICLLGIIIFLISMLAFQRFKSVQQRIHSFKKENNISIETESDRRMQYRRRRERRPSIQYWIDRIDHNPNESTYAEINECQMVAGPSSHSNGELTPFVKLEYSQSTPNNLDLESKDNAFHYHKITFPKNVDSINSSFKKVKCDPKSAVERSDDWIDSNSKDKCDSEHEQTESNGLCPQPTIDIVEKSVKESDDKLKQYFGREINACDKSEGTAKSVSEFNAKYSTEDKHEEARVKCSTEDKHEKARVKCNNEDKHEEARAKCSAEDKHEKARVKCNTEDKHEEARVKCSIEDKQEESWVNDKTGTGRPYEYSSFRDVLKYQRPLKMSVMRGGKKAGYKYTNPVTNRISKLMTEVSNKLTKTNTQLASEKPKEVDKNKGDGIEENTNEADKVQMREPHGSVENKRQLKRYSLAKILKRKPKISIDMGGNFLPVVSRNNPFVQKCNVTHT